MANSNQPQESMVLMPFPLRGLEVTTEFSSQPPLTTSIANNVRGYEPTTGRDRGGQRSGLSRYLPQLATAGKIQHLNFIVDPQADALIADTDLYGPLYLDYMDDPSTNNNARHLGNRNNGRRFRRGGSGRQPNRNRPSLQRTHPTITWSDPADIGTGTPLSGTQLNAVATDGILAVAGTFTYSPPSGTVLEKGNGQALATTFTPTDTSLYFSENKTVHINVVDPTGIVTHITKEFGGTLSTFFTLAAQGVSNTSGAFVGRDPGGSLVPGAITITPTSDTKPTSPSISIAVNFVPTDPVTYNVANDTFNISVDTVTLEANGVVDSAVGGANPVDCVSVVAFNGVPNPPLAMSGVTAEPDPMGTSYPQSPADDGTPISLRYDPSGMGTWYYTWTP